MKKQAGPKTLEEENKNLKQILAMKAESVSIDAHQIRTSLSAIKWIIKMFLDGDLGKLTDEQADLLKKAFVSSERTLGIINEMLLTSRTEKISEKKYKFEKVDMAEIIENSIFDFSGESRMKGMEVIFLKHQEGLPEIKADREKISIVFQNLLENAVKYGNNQSKIFISAKMDGKVLEISVKDTGIGISKAGQSKIFEQFFRDENAKKKEAVGSGIGLFTAKKIVEAHSGKIWFESVEGDGTTFYFTIPISAGK